ncbi:MAG: hypothetical protein ABUL62_11040 [Myxococcales bacterium]|jgi:hypothetical protein
MAISKHGIRSVAVAMCAISVLGSASAMACGGDWYPEVQIDPRIHGVAQAEKAMTKGDYVAAAGFVVRMMPHIKTLDAKKDPLVARAERVLAVSIARSSGKLGLEQEVPSEFLGHWQGRTQAEQSESLAWSVSALRAELTTKKDDPALTTDLAEALSKRESSRDEARALLESLAARDLVATPQGYKALAELRRERGDEAGQKVAMKRCESMATGSKVCESSAPRAS